MYNHYHYIYILQIHASKKYLCLPQFFLWGVSDFKSYVYLGGGLKYVLICTPIPGEMIQFDEHIFKMGWFNHQLDILSM